jgi:PAS domain S-box-containing protein
LLDSDIIARTYGLGNRVPDFAPEDSTARRLELFRVLVEEARDYAIFFLDPEGRVASWNAGAERIKGYRQEEILGRHFSLFFAADEVAAGKPNRELARAAAEGRVEDEGWRVRKDGSRFWATVVLTAVRDADGALIGFTKLSRDMTAWHQAREEIRQSREDLAVTLRSVGDALIATDKSGRVTLMNPVAEQLTGWRADEALGQTLETVFRIVNEETRHTVENPVERALREGKIVGLANHTLLIARDGTERAIADSASPIRHQDGSVRGVVLIFRDQTAERAAEATREQLVREHAARAAAEASAAALRESEERIRAVSERLGIVLEGVADGITMQDPSGRIVFANGVAAEMCGYGSAHEMTAAPLSDFGARFALFDADDRPLGYERVPNRRALAGQGPSSLLVHVRDRSNGRDWWSQLAATPITGADGRLEGAVTIWHDVTAQRRREDELKFLVETGALLSSSLDYETTLTKLTEALVPRLGDWCAIELLEGEELRLLSVEHVDPAKVSLAWNLRAKYPPDPKVARGAYQVARTGRAELYTEIPDELLAAGAQDAEHLRIIRDVGMKSAMVVPLSPRDGTVVGVMTVISTTAARRYDRGDLALLEVVGRRAALAIENARLYREARGAIHVRDEFLATAGHELKTPLAALQLQLQSLARFVQRDGAAGSVEQLRERIDKTLALGWRLDELIKELLDVSRITAGRLTLERELCDLVALARAVLDRFADQLAGAGATATLRGPSRVEGHWDRARLDLVVTNLITNAIKYAPGKPIEITVEVPSPGKARLVVKDHGIGIAPEDQARIFGPFERAVSGRHYGGFGLGLWIVRQVVEAHGGAVRLESSPGQGSTFFVDLPSASASASASASG